MIGEPRDGALQEGAHGVGALVIEHFHVGQARAVVDADMHELPARAARAAGAVAVDAVALAPGPAEFLDVDVDSSPGIGRS